jgi:Ni2+-binding GTPase involved in maturation of urease and hydrogenase
MVIKTISNIMKLDIIKFNIYTFRDLQVMTDRDLAELFEVETRVLCDVQFH